MTPDPDCTAVMWKEIRQNLNNDEKPDELRVTCANRHCAFTGTTVPQPPAYGGR